jgi:hypothetical protein
MIGGLERSRMLAAPLCGPRVLLRVESIGIHVLADLRDCDPWELMYAINLQAGRPIRRPLLAVQALQNLSDAAERERTRGG